MVTPQQQLGDLTRRRASSVGMAANCQQELVLG
jgi:hypothetical protein